LVCVLAESTYITQAQLNVLFSNVAQIHDLNRKFLEELEARLNSWTRLEVKAQCLGQPFRRTIVE